MAIKKRFPYRAALVACNGGCAQPALKTVDAKMAASDVEPV